MYEYLYYLGFGVCAASGGCCPEDEREFARLALKIKTAIEKFGGIVLITSTEWELLQRAKNMCGELK